jgi:hypothetical protein
MAGLPHAAHLSPPPPYHGRSPSRGAPLPSTSLSWQVSLTRRTKFLEWTTVELRDAMKEDKALEAAMLNTLYRDLMQRKRVARRNSTLDGDGGGGGDHASHVREYEVMMRAVLADGLLHPMERDLHVQHGDQPTSAAAAAAASAAMAAAPCRCDGSYVHACACCMWHVACCMLHVLHACACHVACHVACCMFVAGCDWPVTGAAGSPRTPGLTTSRPNTA